MPADITNDVETTSSKFLDGRIKDYAKVQHGNIIMLESEFSSLLKRCPRFKTWIKILNEKSNDNQCYNLACTKNHRKARPPGGMSEKEYKPFPIFSFMEK